MARELAPKCYEFSDFLVNKLGVTDLGARFPHKVTFHDGCHGLRELDNKRPPRELLAKVHGLELVEMAEAETCCGFGGTFAAKFPMISTAMGEVKCASALDTGAEYIVSSDSSCLMHIQGLIDRQGKPIKTIHLAEILVPAMSAPAVQFKHDARRLSADLRHRRIIQTALGKYEIVRDQRKAAFQDWEGGAAGGRGDQVGSHQSSRPLPRTVRAANSRRAARRSTGPAPAQQARDIILGILRDKKARSSSSPRR